MRGIDLPRGRKSMVAFMTCGYPERDLFVRLMMEAVRAGADALEIGIPFSDPLADGPTIQRANCAVLNRGFRMEVFFETVRELSSSLGVPLIGMSYYNPILSYGEERFVERALEVGLSGLIVPDLPFDEGRPFYSRCRELGLDPVLMLTPLTPEERARRILAESSGFVYCVSFLGVTGAHKEVSMSWVKGVVSALRRESPIPLLLGFGLRSGSMVRSISPHVDGVVLGSALVNVIDESALHGTDPIAGVGELLREVREALDGGDEAIQIPPLALV